MNILELKSLSLFKEQDAKKIVTKIFLLFFVLSTPILFLQTWNIQHSSEKMIATALIKEQKNEPALVKKTNSNNPPIPEPKKDDGKDYVDKDDSYIIPVVVGVGLAIAGIAVAAPALPVVMVAAAAAGLLYLWQNSAN